MRREKLEITDINETKKVLDAAEWGVLGIHGSEYPALVPLNFVSLDKVVYFHGALAGEKFNLAKENPLVSFVVVEAYSQLPSYFFDEKAACPATQLYKSVILRGKLRLVDCDREKAAALQALMEKLQPEGGHEPITAESSLYQNKLKGVAVIAMDLHSHSTKFKLGQDRNDEWRDSVEKQLGMRGCPIDHSTIIEMKELRKA